MSLPLIPHPETDEWFAVWLLRTANRYGMSLHSFVRGLTLHPAKPRAIGWLHTMTWTDTQWRHFSDEAHIEIEAAKAMQTVGIPIAKGSQIGFCPTCVLEGTTALWRRSWMDAAATWCRQHQLRLVPCIGVGRLAHQSCSKVVAALQALAQTNWSSMPVWLDDLAYDADEMGILLFENQTANPELGPTGVALLRSLVDVVLRRILSALQDYDDATHLARLLGAASADALSLPLLPKRATSSRVPLLGLIRFLDQRTWLLGSAARIIGPLDPQTEPHVETAEHRDATRSWLWSRLDAWELVDLVAIVRKATAQKLMVPWTAVESWKSPRTGAEWFRRATESP